MIRQYSPRPLCVLLWISIFILFSIFLTHKVLAGHEAACTFENHHPPVSPDCTAYFPDIVAYPPCNPELGCANTAFKTSGSQCVLGGSLNGTQCCSALNPDYFCDQRDLGAGAIAQYDFRCCKIPSTPTPVGPIPTPVVVGCLKDGITTLDCIPEYLQRIVNMLLLFAGVVALIFIIHSGLKFVLSSGDPKKVEEARNTFFYAIMGLIIILFAFLIINIVSFVTGVNCIKFFGFICL